MKEEAQKPRPLGRGAVTQEITTRTCSFPPAPMTREVSDLIAILNSSLQRSADGKRWEIAEGRLAGLTGARQALEARQADLRRSLTRAAPREIAECIRAMFLRCPSSANAPDMAARIAAYTADLSPFPLWIVEAAIAECSRGAQFAPSSGQLVEAARKAKSAITDEGLKIDRILQADVAVEQSQAERDAISRGFDELLETLRWNEPHSTRERPQTKAELLRAVERMAANPVVLPPMSSALAALVLRRGVAA